MIAPLKTWLSILKGMGWSWSVRSRAAFDAIPTQEIQLKSPYKYSFKGWPAQAVMLPDQGVLLCLIYWSANQSPLSLHDWNHNIYRLNKDGNVVWQIQRDENGILNWESLHRHARERGDEGARWPFENLSIVYADGSHNHSALTGTPPPVDKWVPGCRILSTSAQGYGYEIDIERGVARNTADGAQRPW